ncbi:MAG TPA: hypothetical protein VFS26_01300, partial [Solirubrobacterales bacterium]|nr:hypothetical protein [Solirubrobacterales bacterium]
VCRLEGADGLPLRRESPGMPPAGGEWAVVERAGAVLRFRPPPETSPAGREPRKSGAGSRVADLRGGSWEIEGDLAALEASIEETRIASATYPDPLARVWSALTAPHAGDFIVSLAPGFEAVDWGGVSHAGGGSHGALHAGDSLGPLLFVGCGPGSAAEREQWTLRDVAPAVRAHFGMAAQG